MKQFYVEPTLKKNLDMVKPHVHKNWDMCFIVSGIEGAGKSTFAVQLAYYLTEGRFTIDHVCFTPKDFMDKITRPNFLKPGDALLLDEGFMVNSRASMSKLNREFLSILAECRQKQLYLIINCPNFFDLDRNISLWRSRGLFYVDHYSFKRGYFRFWNADKKKKLYLSGKKFFDYNKVKHDFRGTFPKTFPLDEEEYKRRKLKAFENREVLSEYQDRFRMERAVLIYFIKNYGINLKEVSDFFKKEGFSVSKDSLRKVYERYKAGRRARDNNTNIWNDKEVDDGRE